MTKILEYKNLLLKGKKKQVSKNVNSSVVNSLTSKLINAKMKIKK